MFLIPSAFAATLPTECPTAIVTGDEVADLRAELVAPIAVAAGQAVAALRVDAECPTADGSACTDSNGDAWEGTLTEGTEYFSEGCSRDWTWGTGITDGVTASAVGWAPLAGSPTWLGADGASTHTEFSNCDYAYSEDAWSGALQVEGAWDPLPDASIDADASVREDWGYDPYCNHNTSQSWEGTSGDCSWSASTYQYLCDGTTWEAQGGTVTIGSNTVRWFTEQETWCDGFSDPVWRARMWIDDVPIAPTDPYWDGGRIGEAWIDADLDGYSATTDCDDADPDVHPCADEIWGNPADEDCDGTADDIDGDGRTGDNDCDDLDATVYIRAAEVCGDGVDQDCDGADSPDLDGDTFCDDGDCDDADATTWDGAPDDADAVDHDCDGDADEDGYPFGRIPDCDDTEAAIHPGAEEVPYDGVDDDCSGGDADDLDYDGHAAVVAGGDDCDDTDDDINPDRLDYACDGIDQDCDGADLCDEARAAAAAACECGTSSPYGSILALLIAVVAVRRR